MKHRLIDIACADYDYYDFMIDAQEEDCFDLSELKCSDDGPRKNASADDIKDILWSDQESEYDDQLYQQDSSECVPIDMDGSILQEVLESNVNGGTDTFGEFEEGLTPFSNESVLKDILHNDEHGMEDSTLRQNSHNHCVHNGTGMIKSIFKDQSDYEMKKNTSGSRTNISVSVGTVANKKDIFPLVDDLLKHHQFICLEGVLYVFKEYWIAINRDNCQRIIRFLLDSIDIEKKDLLSSQIKEIYIQLSSKPEIYRTKEECRTNFCVITFLNGTYDVLNHQFSYSFSPLDYQFTQIPYCYDEVFECDQKAKDYVSRFCNYDNDRELYFWELIGYLLSNIQEKIIVMIYGPGNCGKSTLAQFIQRTIGIELCVSIQADKLSDNFNLGELPGKKLCVDGDMRSASLKSSAVSVIKQISGNDWMQANSKFQKQFYFCNTAKLLWCSNHKLKIADNEEVEHIANRLKVFELYESIPFEEQNTNILSVLEDNRGYFLTKAIEGLTRLIDNGFCFTNPDDSMEYIENSSCNTNARAIMKFVDDVCVLSEELLSSSNELYDAYVQYLLSQNHTPCSQKLFITTLVDTFNLEKGRTNLYRYIRGIGLREFSDA